MLQGRPNIADRQGQLTRASFATLAEHLKLKQWKPNCDECDEGLAIWFVRSSGTLDAHLVRVEPQDIFPTAFKDGLDVIWETNQYVPEYGSDLAILWYGCSVHILGF